MKKKGLCLSALLAASLMISGTAMAEAVTEAPEDVTEAVEDVEGATEAEVTSQVVELGDRPAYHALDYVTLGEYRDLPVQIDPIQVSEEQIDDAIESAISLQELYEAVTEGTVADGDTVNIDFVGKKDEVAFDGGSAEGYDLTIGSGTFIPGFEEGLVGVPIGETVDLQLTFPEAYQNADLAGQDVVFTVTVNSVRAVPEITDDLVNTLSDGAYSTVDGYREYQRQQLTEQAQQAQKSAVSSELMTQLYNTCAVESYPQDLLDYSLTEMKNYYAAYADMYGVSLEEFLTSYMGMEPETFETQAQLAVEQSLTQELILTAIAEQENLAEISDEEFEAGCAEYASELGYEDSESFRNAYDREKILSSLRMDKAMDFVRENALITVNEPETETLEELTEQVTE